MKDACSFIESSDELSVKEILAFLIFLRHAGKIEKIRGPQNISETDKMTTTAKRLIEIV